MIKGFAIDVEKMKNGPKFGKDYTARELTFERVDSKKNIWDFAFGKIAPMVK